MGTELARLLSEIPPRLTQDLAKAELEFAMYKRNCLGLGWLAYIRAEY
jgi:hypothetical protein